MYLYEVFCYGWLCNKVLCLSKTFGLFHGKHLTLFPLIQFWRAGSGSTNPQTTTCQVSVRFDCHLLVVCVLWSLVTCQLDGRTSEGWGIDFKFTKKLINEFGS